VNITVKLSDKAAARVLGKAATLSMLPVMKRFGEHIKRVVIQKAFDSEADPATGTKWRPTSAFTLASRPGGGTGGKTLRDTGRLMQAYMAVAPRATAESVEIVPTAIKYSAIHQFGGVIKPKKGKFLQLPMNRAGRRQGMSGTKVPGAKFVLARKVTIPKRPFLGFSKDVREDLRRMIVAHIRDAAK